MTAGTCWLNEDCIAGPSHEGGCRFPSWPTVETDALTEAAARIEAELICCDVFDRLRDKPSKDWAPAERAEYRRHSICYWGEAARRIVLDVQQTRGDVA